MRFSEYLYSTLLSEAEPAAPAGGTTPTSPLGGGGAMGGPNPLSTGNPPPLGGLGGMGGGLGGGGLGMPQSPMQGKVKPLVVKAKDVWSLLDKALSKNNHHHNKGKTKNFRDQVSP